jgi:ATP-dependent DNA helicase RecG
LLQITLNDLDKKRKNKSLLSACLPEIWVSNEKMSNQSLRERFKIEDHNYSAIASRIIIRDAIDEASMIKEDDPDSKSRKHMLVTYHFGLNSYLMVI